MDYSLRAGPRITPKCSRTALFVVLQCCFNQLFGPFLLVLLLVSFSEPAQAAPLFGQEYNSNEYYANSTSQSHLNARAVGGPGQPDLFLIVLIPGSDMYKHLAWLYDAIALNGGSPSPYPAPSLYTNPDGSAYQGPLNPDGTRAIYNEDGSMYVPTPCTNPDGSAYSGPLNPDGTPSSINADGTPYVPVPFTNPDGSAYKGPLNADGSPSTINPDGSEYVPDPYLNADGSAYSGPLNADGTPSTLNYDGTPYVPAPYMNPDGSAYKGPLNADGSPSLLNADGTLYVPAPYLNPDGTTYAGPMNSDGTPSSINEDGTPYYPPAVTNEDGTPYAGPVNPDGTVAILNEDGTPYYYPGYVAPGSAPEAPPATTPTDLPPTTTPADGSTGGAGGSDGSGSSTPLGGMDANGQYHNKDGSLYTGPLTPEGYPSATNEDGTPYIVPVKKNRDGSDYTGPLNEDGTASTLNADGTPYVVPIAKNRDGSPYSGPTNEDGTPSTMNIDGTPYVVPIPTNKDGSPYSGPVNEDGTPSTVNADGSIYVPAPYLNPDGTKYSGPLNEDGSPSTINADGTPYVPIPYTLPNGIPYPGPLNPDGTPSKINADGTPYTGPGSPGYDPTAADIFAPDPPPSLPTEYVIHDAYDGPVGTTDGGSGSGPVDVYAGFGIYTAVLRGVVLDALATRPEVESISADSLAFIAAPEQPILTQKAAPWHLIRSSTNTTVTNKSAPNYYYNGTAGAGVDIFLLDTGIYIGHQDFGSRAKLLQSFGKYALKDGNGHGTFCAGVAGGTKYGVAKKARLLGIKVFGDDGAGSTADIVKGLNYVATVARKSKKPSVVSLSFSGPPNAGLDAACRALVAKGIHVTVAAGNNNDDASLYSPGRIATVTTVGSITQKDEASPFSNWGSNVDIWAPGSGIFSDWIGGPNIGAELSGTSMATPVVAGMKAYLISLFGNPTPAEMKEWLQAASSYNVSLSVPFGTNSSIVGNCYGRACFRPLKFNATDPARTSDHGTPGFPVTVEIIPFAQRNITKPRPRKQYVAPSGSIFLPN